MSDDLRAALASDRYAADRVEAALGNPSEAHRVFSAVRAESEERLLAAASAWLRASANPAQPSLRPLARERFEGLVGVLEERACDHLAGLDVIRLAKVIPDCTHDDLVDLFALVELGDDEARERLGERLRTVPLDALPDELESDAVGAQRLYSALRARFSGPDEELEFLDGRNGPRLICAGAAVLAEAQGAPWPELIPAHNRGSTNASRALVWAAAASGNAVLERWISRLLEHFRTKGRVACAELAWDQRFDGVGGGQVVAVRRHRTIVISEVGKPLAKVGVVANRPRRSVKIHKQIAKAEADFAARVEKATKQHALEPIDAATLGPALERCCAALPSDVAVALMDLGAPCPDLFWFRGDPELTRRAIATGIDVAEQTAPGGEELLACVGPFYWDFQRAELLAAAGARVRTPKRLTEAAERGELHLARLLVAAGSPIEAEALEKGARWPRLHRCLRDASETTGA